MFLLRGMVAMEVGVAALRHPSTMTMRPFLLSAASSQFTKSCLIYHLTVGNKDPGTSLPLKNSQQFFREQNLLCEIFEDFSPLL